MGIEGISGGSMRALQAMQAVKPAQGGPDFEAMQSAGLRLDQEVRQLMRMLEHAAAMGEDPARIQQLMQQLQQLTQAAPAPSDDQGGVSAAGAGGVSGAAAQDLAQRLEDLKKQIETISNAAAAEGAGLSQHNLVNQQLSVLGRDENQAQGRDFMNMY